MLPNTIQSHCFVALANEIANKNSTLSYDMVLHSEHKCTISTLDLGWQPTHALYGFTKRKLQNNHWPKSFDLPVDDDRI